VFWLDFRPRSRGGGYSKEEWHSTSDSAMKPRLTRDIDVGLRDAVSDVTELHDRLIEALTTDPDHGRSKIDSASRA
jgi:hypothetical protein